MPVKVNADACIGCGACTGVCPTSSLNLNAEGKCEVVEDTCVDCCACMGTCPVGAISQ
ncbi:MAG: 4Fe-4S binding protein [Erysipelotrichaceae bacterium]|nr:4Fe-4S binding protein [Erysipelotrichaceae bacterium]